MGDLHKWGEVDFWFIRGRAPSDLCIASDIDGVNRPCSNSGPIPLATITFFLSRGGQTSAADVDSCTAVDVVELPMLCELLLQEIESLRASRNSLSDSKVRHRPLLGRS